MKFIKNEDGSGIAIYILTTFIIMTLVALSTTSIYIRQADSVKQKGQTLLLHSLADAAHTAEILPEYVGSKLISRVNIPDGDGSSGSGQTQTALKSFCTADFDNVSIAKVFDMKEPGTANCVGSHLLPKTTSVDFPEGIYITDFVVVNSTTDPNYSAYSKVNGEKVQPPFIYAKIEVPKTFTVISTDYTFTFKIAAIYRPALVDARDGNFVLPCSISTKDECK